MSATQRDPDAKILLFSFECLLIVQNDVQERAVDTASLPPLDRTITGCRGANAPGPPARKLRCPSHKTRQSCLRQTRKERLWYQRAVSLASPFDQQVILFW